MRARAGFTLIELMIVVAIIAIIAAIAIPNLMESKKSANEARAGACLKAYLNAQAQYQANNYSFVPANGGDGTQATAKLYAAAHHALGGAGAHVNSGGDKMRLLAAPVAEAVDEDTAHNGYFFVDIVSHAGAATLYRHQHGLCAVPALYCTTAVRQYIVNAEGVVYSKDTGAGGNGSGTTDWPTNPVAAGWTVN